MVDLGLNDVDPGLAPEGARCDEDSLCVNRKCMPVASLTIGPASCPGNCHGHGTCNSKGHCHCDIGYAPPYCDVPGPGGSLDSGPASDSEASSSNWFILLYIVLLLVPIMAIVFLLSQKVRRGDWRLLVEKAKPRKRLSEVDPMAAASVAEAAAAAASTIPGGKSGTSSPTQALLPHVDTSTSALSTVLSERLQGEAASSSATSNKSSRSGSLFANLKKPQFMQNLAKSISLPSPKLRAAMKNMATYEIKVEHQVPKEDLSSPSEEIVTEGAEVKTSKDSVLFIKEEKVNVQTTTVDQPPMTASKSLTTFGSRPVRSTLPMSSSFRSTLTTSTSSTSSSTTAAVTSFESSSSNASCKPPQQQPMPIAQSKVLEKVKALETTTSTTVINDQKPKDDGVVTLLPTTESVIASIVVSSTSNSNTSSSSTASKVTTTTSAASASVSVAAFERYSQDPKLAFPHSSSFAGRASSAFTSSATASSTTTTTAAASKVGSSQSANSLHRLSNATSSTAASVSTSADKVKKKNGSKDSVEVLTQPLLDKAAVAKAKPPPPAPPAKPTSLKSSHLKDEVKSEVKTTPSEAVKAEKATVIKSPSSPTKASSSPSSSSVTSPSSSTTMPLLSKTSTLPFGSSSAENGSKKAAAGLLPKSSTLPIVPSRPVIGKPVLQMATPDATSLIAKSHSTGVSQSSIIKGGASNSNNGSNSSDKTKDEVDMPKEVKRASRGVVFCDPLTLPSPTNPNNPPIIHIQPKPAQTVTTPPKPTPPKSVLSPVTSVTTTVPVAKPVEAKAVVVSSVITPTWSTEPKAVSSSAVLCHIDDTDSGSSEAGSPTKKDNGAPMASPESDKVIDSGLSGSLQKTKSLSKSLKSKLVKRSHSEKNKEKASKAVVAEDQNSGLSSPTSSLRSSNDPLPTGPPPRPERRPISKLDISGPLLQTNVEMKGNFLPVCRAADATPTDTMPAISFPPISTSSASVTSMASDPSTSTTSTSKVVTSAKQISPKKNKAPQPPPIIPRRQSPSKTASSNKSEVASVKKSSSVKRPASIATTRPSRPSAPPPRPPPQRPNVGGSPTRSDTSSLASIDSSVSSSTATSKGPSVTSEDESCRSAGHSKKTISPLTSPLSLDDFDTPLSSPIIARRSPDALSTASSSDGGDLMREILKDLDTEVKEEVSTLMRKKKNKKRLSEG